MTSITMPVRAEAHPHLRSLNILRDLPAVADLIELCFSNNMDSEGKRYVQDMRKAGHDSGFLHWAARVGDSASLPLSGYIWEEDGRIVGNASLVPFHNKKQRIYLIANVAVHPDFRRRGIARSLTERALVHARQKRASAVWLHVRVDNPGAIRMYADLGFVERARRTSWSAAPDTGSPAIQTDFTVTGRLPAYWPLQQEWLRHTHPDELAWHRPWKIPDLRPGFMNWISQLFMDIIVQQWAVVKDKQLLAVLSYLPRGRDESLYAAVRPGADPGALTVLLLYARRLLSYRTQISIDLPAGEFDESLQGAGFSAQRTLIWMSSATAT